MDFLKTFAVPAAAMALFVAGCGEKANNGATAAEEPAAQAAEPAATAAEEPAAPAEEPAAMAEEPAEPAVAFDADEAVVTAYGKTLTYAEAMATIRRAMQSQGVPEAQLDAAIAQMQGIALPQIASEFVMFAALQDVAAKAGYSCTDEEVEAEFDEAATHLPPGVTIEQALERSGTTAEEIKKQIRDSLPIKKFFDKLVDGTDVSDDDVAKFYEERKDDTFTKPEQIRASHILVTVASDASEEDKAAARAKIEGLLAQIKDGADFAELAKANSDCPSKERGGDLDWFGRHQMVKPFEDAAFALADGEVSEIVETPFGFHIIKKTGNREAGVTPLEEVAGEIRDFLLNRKKGELVEEYTKSLQKKVEFTQSEKIEKLFAAQENEAEADAEAGADPESVPDVVEPAAAETPAPEPAEPAAEPAPAPAPSAE